MTGKGGAANALRAGLQNVVKVQPMPVVRVGTQQQKKVVYYGTRAYITTKVLQQMVTLQWETLLVTKFLQRPRSLPLLTWTVVILELMNGNSCHSS